MGCLRPALLGGAERGQDHGQVRGQAAEGVSTGVKLPTYAGLKFPSLLTAAGHCDLLNVTPPRMLSVWFQPTEGTKVITWERLFMLHELHAQGVSISAIARLVTAQIIKLYQGAPYPVIPTLLITYHLKGHPLGARQKVAYLVDTR